MTYLLTTLRQVVRIDDSVNINIGVTVLESAHQVCKSLEVQLAVVVDRCSCNAGEQQQIQVQNGFKRVKRDWGANGLAVVDALRGYGWQRLK